MNEHMELFLKLTVDKVSKNVTVITKEELNQKYMLHISPDKMNNKPYIPWISRRQAMMEDRTVPRITVAPTLFGCYVGYTNLIPQFFQYDPESEDKYRQGLYIHEIEFDQALKPNNRLVYDSSRSDEHWLVTYDESTKIYRGRCIGKMFIQEIKVKGASSAGVICDATIYVEVNKPEGIRFSKNLFLSRGYHVVSGIMDVDHCSWDKDKGIITQEISRGEYDSVKRQTAAMLSLDVSKPPFANW